MKKKPRLLSKFFDRFSSSITKATGRPGAFIIAVILILAWGISGPIFKFSTTWQLVINTGTTIITFLMVFLIQQSVNKDTMAMQLKLNELIASDNYASNRLIDIEELTEEELEIIKKFYRQLSKLSKQKNDLHSTHSLDEAKQKFDKKIKIETGSSNK